MKYFSFFLLIIIFLGCEDNSQSPVINKYTDIFSVGNSFEYQNENQKMIISVIEEKSIPWILNFWNEDSITHLNSIILEIKYFKEKLPVYFHCAIANDGKHKIFGTAKPQIPEKFIEDSLYYKSFYLYDEIIDTTIIHKEIKDYGSFIFKYTDSLIYAGELFETKDTAYSVQKINHFRKQFEFGELTQSGEIYAYNKEMGFIQFWNYLLETKLIIE